MKSRWIFLLGIAAILAISAAPAASAKPVEMRWAVEMEIASVDPSKSTNNWEWVIALNIYDTLLFPDPDPKIKLKPWIADSWTVSPDGKTYTFKLKKGLKFHDGGEITADDVVFSMERLAQAGGPVATQFKMMKPGATKAVDKYTVAFNLSHKDPAFLARMTVLRILNKNLVMKNKAPGKYGEYGDFGEKFLTTNDAGSGPYRVASMKHSDRLVLEKFQDYTQAKWAPNSIDRITVFMIPEIVTIAAKFEKGEIDLGIWSLPPKTIEGWRKNPNYLIKDDVAATSWYMVMNNKKPPFDDPYVR
ncbi:MAG TPA: ABC transporter substrate-binding protein, partial [Thermodesulfobacteriota bacterium]|nr:ABC transporter substrate-binding protein [Thermodesulfobacteriota bacterium]